METFQKIDQAATLENGSYAPELLHLSAPTGVVGANFWRGVRYALLLNASDVVDGNFWRGVRYALLLNAVLWLIILALLAGCGGGASTSGPPPQVALTIPPGDLPATGGAPSGCNGDPNAELVNGICLANAGCPTGYLQEGIICTPAPVSTPTSPLPTCQPNQYTTVNACLCQPPDTISDVNECLAPPAPTCDPPALLSGNVCITPAPTVACPTGVTANALTACICPASDYSSVSNECSVPNPLCPGYDAATCPAPTVACPIGVTPNAQDNCVCPATNYDSVNGACIVPNPQCPGYDTLTCPAPTSCPTGQALVDGTCITPAIGVTASPTTITLADDANDPSACGPLSCASITWVFTSSIASDTPLCTDQRGNPVLNDPVAVGPYPPANDGSVFIWTITCTDSSNVPAVSASVTITVVAPPPVPLDAFTCAANADASVTCTWSTLVAGATCSVVDEGNGFVLTPGGTPSGTATSAIIFAPTSFELDCNGVRDTNTSTANPITVSP